MLSGAAKLKRKTDYTVREIYRPILRGYFTVFAIYYLTMIPTHFWYFTGAELFNMAAAATAAAVVGIFGVWLLRKAVPARRLELLLTTMNFLVVSNVFIALSIDFSTDRLTYFIIMAMLFALASVSFRQSVLSIGMAVAALVSFMPLLDDETFAGIAFLVFGAAMASLAIAFFLRKAIAKIAHSKINAEEQLEEARVVGEALRDKTLSDSLTGLPNRRGFFGFLRQAVRDVQASGTEALAKRQNIWLILADLDGFKAVNDIHGHLTGDMLLKNVASRLNDWAGDGVHVSRMGGDEFNFIVVTNDDEAEIRDRCEALLESLAQPYVIEGRHIRISASVGCKMLNLNESTRSQISRADFALMVAKKQGKNCAVVFNQEHARQAEARYEVEDALRNANLSEEIGLVFQPQMDIGSNRIISAEALARWQSPVLGAIGPERFIKVAEESGLITGISLMVVEKAFAELQSWDRPIPISINLSSHDLISDPTVDQVIYLAEQAGIDPSYIEFEVTETAMMADFEKATANLEKLAAIGFSIALDDFGTGYSNFSYLRALPIEKLKVDRSFIEDPGDPMTEKILASLAGMARILGVHCLLEGVEDEVDLLMAKRAGAESVQGYLFGEPMSAADLQARVMQQADTKGAAAAA